jgi:uncharacterized membrane protein YsdA (DUF1294 family)
MSVRMHWRILMTCLMLLTSQLLKSLKIRVREKCLWKCLLRGGRFGIKA